MQNAVLITEDEFGSQQDAPAAVSDAADHGLPGRYRWPAVPVAQGTQYALEALLRSRDVELSEVSRVVLGDLGATIQILRRVSQEESQSSIRIPRISECLLTLGKAEFLEALTCVTEGPLLDRCHPYAAVCRYSWVTSQFSSLIAESTPDVEPEQAHIAGLLHNLGYLPSVLGWRTLPGLPTGISELGCYLIKEWRLPLYLMFAVRCSDRTDDAAPVIGRIVAAALDCQKISADGVYAGNYARYAPYWLAILERYLPECSDRDREGAVRRLISQVPQIQGLGCKLS